MLGTASPIYPYWHRNQEGHTLTGTHSFRTLGLVTQRSWVRVPVGAIRAWFRPPQNSGPRQGRVRQLAPRASLGSIGESDHERVSWSLYKRGVPPVCIPGATVGDKRVKGYPRTLWVHMTVHTSTQVHPGLGKLELSVNQRMLSVR